MQSGDVIPLIQPVEVGDSLIQLNPSDLSLFSENDWVLIRSGDLTPNVTAGSRVAMLRKVDEVTAALRLDAAIYRDMTLDVGGSIAQVRKALLSKGVIQSNRSAKAFNSGEIPRKMIKSNNWNSFVI